MKIILWIVGVVVAVGIGFGIRIAMQGNNNAPAVQPQVQTGQPMVAQTGGQFRSDIASALPSYLATGSHKCQVNTPPITYYLTPDYFMTEQVPSNTTPKYQVIELASGRTYFWGSLSSRVGLTSVLDASAIREIFKYFPKKTDSGFVCESWTPDTSIFKIPSDVQFSGQ